jgi:DNA-binding beta-propeller fold protein YncE
MEKLLFSTDTDSGTITVLNLSTGHPEPVARINVGNGPRGAVRFTANGRGFVSNHAGNTISEIDAYSLAEMGRITVGSAPIGIAIVPGDRFALVSNGGDNTISIVDLLENREVHKVSVGREPRHLDVTRDGKFAYAPMSAAHYVSKIDVTALGKAGPAYADVREVCRIFLGEGTFPYSTAISPDGHWVIAANNQKPFVSLIESSTDQVADEIDVGTKGARGVAFSPDSKHAFVSLENTSEVVVVELESRKVIQRLAAANGPRGMYYDADLTTLFVAGFYRGAGERAGNAVSILHFSPAMLKNMSSASPELRDVPVGAGPCSISVYVR